MTGPEEGSEERSSRSLTGLVGWLLLVPLVFGSLMCFGQLALILSMEIPSALTRSLLRADYGAWAYDEIAQINLAAFLEDARREQQRYGVEEPFDIVNEGVYWVPPTPTPGSIALVPPLRQETATIEPTSTPSPVPAVLTPTPRQSATVTLTLAPTLTITRTNTRISFLASPTTTVRPQEPPTSPSSTSAPATVLPATPTPGTPMPPTLTFTPVPPTESFTPEPLPSDTPESPELPTPTYAPVRPIAEDNGVSEPFEGGCRAYFGYRNANPQEVIIPFGEPRNYFSIQNAVVEPFLPELFLIGRKVGALYVIWNTPGPFTWYLEGAEATAIWCNP